MPGRRDFFDDFYNETMTEMADSFFTRRKEMERRLEGFAKLAQEVQDVGAKAVRRWRTFFLLLVNADKVTEFFRRRGVDTGDLAVLAAGAHDPWRFRPPFALTSAGRYRKCVRYAYESLRQATLDYNEGSYGTDPKNPRKKVLLPNYGTLEALANKINEEVRAVNTGQTPSAVLSFARSMDVVGMEKEAVVGGMVGEDVGKLDRELAFKPVDFQALGLPVLPKLPPLEEIQDELDALSGEVFLEHQDEAKRAMDFVSAR